MNSLEFTVFIASMGMSIPSLTVLLLLAPALWMTIYHGVKQRMQMLGGLNSCAVPEHFINFSDVYRLIYPVSDGCADSKEKTIRGSTNLTDSKRR